MSEKDISVGESTDVNEDYSFTTQMKFKTYSLRWNIEDYDIVSKTVKRLKSHEFPLDGEEKDKWYIEFEPPEITETNEKTFKIDITRKFAQSSQTYIHVSLSFITSSGTIYGPQDYMGLSCEGCTWEKMSGKLLHEELIWNETSRKTLIISCKVRVLESIEDVCKKISIRSFRSKDCLQEISQFFLNDQTFHDITISVKDKEFKAHKAILAARSQVFAAMFSHEMSEKINKIIEIKDLNPEIVEKMLRFIYGDKVDDLDLRESAIELLAAAEKYGLERLKEICSAAMHKNLGIHNVLKTLEAADTYSIPDLKKVALNFVSLHSQVVKNMEEFKPLFAKRPHLTVELIDILNNMSDNSKDEEYCEVFKTTLDFKTE